MILVVPIACSFFFPPREPPQAIAKAPQLAYRRPVLPVRDSVAVVHLVHIVERVHEDDEGRATAPTPCTRPPRGQGAPRQGVPVRGVPYAALPGRLAPPPQGSGRGRACARQPAPERGHGGCVRTRARRRRPGTYKKPGARRDLTNPDTPRNEDAGTEWGASALATGIAWAVAAHKARQAAAAARPRQCVRPRQDYPR